jgi:hypothetical protein
LVESLAGLKALTAYLYLRQLYSLLQEQAEELMMPVPAEQVVKAE